MSEHRASLLWSRDTASFGYEDYSRDHQWTFPGGTVLGASAAPAYRGTPARVDPEEAYVAALASCHMLTLLALASRRGLVVDRYADEALGTMRPGDDGRPWIAHVLLRPRVAFAGEEPSADVLAALHHQAHHECFLANSVRTRIEVEPHPA